MRNRHHVKLQDRYLVILVESPCVFVQRLPDGCKIQVPQFAKQSISGHVEVIFLLGLFCNARRGRQARSLRVRRSPLRIRRIYQRSRKLDMTFRVISGHIHERKREPLTILDPKKLVNKSFVSELCQHRGDHIHSTIQDDKTVNLVRVVQEGFRGIVPGRLL